MKNRTYVDRRGYRQTDALFRTWFQSFHNAVLAVGSWVAVTQTGEFDFTTGTVPTNTTNTRDRWRMYAFADNGVGGLPSFYVKFAVGNNYYTTGTFGYQITIGNAVDGAGNFVGVSYSYSFAENMIGATNNDSTQRNYFVSGDEANTIYWMQQDIGNGDGNLFFAIGRTTDPATGAIDGRGLHFITRGGGNGYGSSGNANQAQIMLGPQSETIYSQEKILAPAVGYNLFASETETYLYPILEPHALTNNALCICCFFTSEIPKVNFTRSYAVPPTGITRTLRFGAFFPQLSNNQNGHYLNVNGNYWSVAFPWEGTTV